MVQANKSIHYYQCSGGQLESIDAEVIVETPVSLTVNGEVWLTFMCTPIDLEAMGVGFLYNEGLIQTKDEIEDVRLCPSGDNLDVWLSHHVEKPPSWRRTSGCTGGVTGVDTSVGGQQTRRTEIRDGLCLPASQIGHLVSMLFEVQDLYRRSGGVHTSALSDGSQIYISTEDIGRHNTLDKIAGHCLLDNIDIAPRLLLTTGRISSEMLQKSARLGACMLISRTSPSSLSIQMAEQWGITLIGYARRDRFNVYSHPQRILAHSPEQGQVLSMDNLHKRI
jgi:FdhD protein